MWIYQSLAALYILLQASSNRPSNYSYDSSLCFFSSSISLFTLETKSLSISNMADSDSSLSFSQSKIP